ncbi:E3 ubiquitin-protein ligase listerin, partial [Aphelenchoides avenae]
MSKAPRRKGNAQTASSSKAAELLHNSGMSVPFINLDAFQFTTTEGGSESAAALLDEFGADVDPEIRIIFKKLSKRDTLTREKAVKELLDAVRSVPAEKLKSSFPYYATAYARLVTDASPTIRSTANALLGAYIGTLKKDAGPNLKYALPFLLLSLNDAYGAVARSADAVLQECFSDEKRTLVTANFAASAIEVAVQFVNKQHKLVQPQKFVEEETDTQRQSRLISQALVTVEKLAGVSAECSTPLYEQFSKPAVLAALMNMAPNVKVAALQLLRKLLSINVEPFLGTRIPSIVLTHLDSADTALCRNAFECFLILAEDPRLYETVKIDKAIVPKLISLMRKKGLHWKVLESSLLPSVAVVHRHLASDAEREKWLRSTMEAFFEGDLAEVPFTSWANAFVEVAKFSLLHSAKTNMVEFLLQETLKFFDLVVLAKDDAAIAPAVQLATWLHSPERATSDETKAHFEQFRKDFRLNVVNKLPDSSLLVTQFLEKTDDADFATLLLKFPATPTQLFLLAVAKQGQEASRSLDLKGTFSRRIAEESSADLKVDLLRALYPLLEEHREEMQIEEILDISDPDLAPLLVASAPHYHNLLSEEERERVLRAALESFLKGTTRRLRVEDVALWASRLSAPSVAAIVGSVLGNEGSKAHVSFCVELIRSVFDLADAFRQGLHPTAPHFLFDYLLDSSVPTEERSRAKELLSQCDVDAAEVRSTVMTRIMDTKAASHDKIEELGKLLSDVRFRNASSEVFLPREDEVLALSTAFDETILTEENLLASYALAGRLVRFRPSGADFTTRVARKALFYAQFGARTSACTAFVALSTAVVPLAVDAEFEKEKCAELEDVVERLRKARLPEGDALAKSILELFYAREEAAGVPLSVLYSLRRTFGGDSSKSAALIDLLHAQEADFTSSQGAASGAHSATMLAVSATGAALSPLFLTRLSELNADAVWIHEFESASVKFNEETRAQAMVMLSMFVEQERARVEEWLFSLQGDDVVKDSLTCAVLRLCAQIVPYILEVDGPIRDFINCGFVSALQSCTDALNAPGKRSSPLLHVLCSICCRLYASYEKCVRLNRKNVDYTDINQEWREFFGPSAVNYIIAWFVGIAQGIPRPAHTELEICRAVHLMDADALADARPEIHSAGTETDASAPLRAFDAYVAANDPRAQVLIHCAKLSLSSAPAVQFAAAGVFKSLLLHMFRVESDATSKGALGGDATTDADQEESEHLGPQKRAQLPKFFREILAEQEPFLLRGAPILSGHESAAVNPVLLLWSALVHFLAELDVVSRVYYCDALDDKLVGNVMLVLFSQIPDPPGRTPGLSAEKAFTERIQFESAKHFSMEHFVSNLFYRSLITVPALIRQWYNSLPKSAALAINRYVRTYVSPLILRREMRNVANMKKGRLE